MGITGVLILSRMNWFTMIRLVSTRCVSALEKATLVDCTVSGDVSMSSRILVFASAMDTASQ